MGLEDLTGADKFIDDLVDTNPASGDAPSQGDDHVRGIKNVLGNCFPGITGAVTSTHTELNILDGVTSTTAELNILDGVTATATEINLLAGETNLHPTASTTAQGEVELATDAETITGTSTILAVTPDGADAAYNQLVSTYTVAGSAVTNIDFSGLDLATDGTYRIELEINNATAGAIQIRCMVNADYTLTNYYAQSLAAASTTVAGARNNDPRIMAVNANGLSHATLYIHRNATNQYLMMTSRVSRGAGASNEVQLFSTTSSGTISNVTSIRIASSAASAIGVGSVVKIYKERV